MNRCIYLSEVNDKDILDYIKKHKEKLSGFAKRSMRFYIDCQNRIIIENVRPSKKCAKNDKFLSKIDKIING